MSDVAIRVEGLSKRYRIGDQQRYRTLRDSLHARLGTLLGRSRREPSSEDRYIWALKDVSFEVRRGEVLGVIGPNGAGKSTLLKLLSQITEPTTGYAEIHGRVGSLLEVGTGFHPELTGRENIFLSGVLLGMRRREIDCHFDEIVQFAGVGRFIDTPVKRYSSGMYVRLAFSVAAHLPAEVLLVDEVLAVGDAAFQFKCLNKMAEVTSEGRTVLFVSHNMEAVKGLCGRAILLDSGRIAFAGGAAECVEHYLEGIRKVDSLGRAEVSLRSHSGRRRFDHGPVRLTGLRILGADGAPSPQVESGGPFELALAYELVDGAGPQTTIFSVIFSNLKDQRISTCVSSHTRLEDVVVEKSGEIVCRIPRLPLVPGAYKLTVGCHTQAGPSDGIYDALQIRVTGGSFYPTRPVLVPENGEVLFDHEWQVAVSRVHV